MVESNYELDLMFAALADRTRRSILESLKNSEQSINQIAKHYSLTFAAISKHIKVLEKAGLVRKQRKGREQIVILVPQSMEHIEDYLKKFAEIQLERFNKLEELLNKGE